MQARTEQRRAKSHSSARIADEPLITVVVALLITIPTADASYFFFFSRDARGKCKPRGDLVALFIKIRLGSRLVFFFSFRNREKIVGKAVDKVWVCETAVGV